MKLLPHVNSHNAEAIYLQLRRAQYVGWAICLVLVAWFVIALAIDQQVNVVASALLAILVPHLVTSQLLHRVVRHLLDRVYQVEADFDRHLSARYLPHQKHDRGRGASSERRHPPV